jgi:hypothetical protein
MWRKRSAIFSVRISVVLPDYPYSYSSVSLQANSGSYVQIGHDNPNPNYFLIAISNIFQFSFNATLTPQVQVEAPCHEGVLGEWRYSYTHSLTLALDRCEWSASRPAALPPGQEAPVPIAKEVGWAPEPFWTRWWREKFPAPAGNRTLEPRSSSP